MTQFNKYRNKLFSFIFPKQAAMLEEYEELKKHILTELESKRMIATGVGMGYYTSDLKLIVTRAANSMKSRQFEEVADGTD